MPASGEEPGLEDLLAQVTLGHEQAFDRVYDLPAGPVFGLARRVVRDRAQAEEVAQEVLVEVWRTASRYDRTRGSALSWVMTMAHRRSVDRVRSAQASAGRVAAGLEEVYALTTPGNEASIAVCRRLGMTPLGRTRRFFDLESEMFHLPRTAAGLP
ncbi:sigma factor [Streptosporangium canum]|uniref:sigma factor n=1 Tax=Streptosporangium canum TaxID=324952 RepID=UPI0036C98C78